MVGKLDAVESFLTSDYELPDLREGDTVLNRPLAGVDGGATPFGSRRLLRIGRNERLASANGHRMPTPAQHRFPHGLWQQSKSDYLQPMPEAQQILRQTNFTAIDWAIVVVYPLISVAIGLYVRRFVKNMTDFVTAGQELGVCLGIATLTGTELGLITVMYSAQKGFTGGFAAFHIALMAGLVTLAVGATGFIVYRLRAMHVLTIPEFYGRRFDRKTRILGGIMMALGGILNMGLFLKVGSMFIVGITGLSATSWALPAVMVFLISLVLIYTCLGGMISVVISDYVQFVVLSFGPLAHYRPRRVEAGMVQHL